MAPPARRGQRTLREEGKGRGRQGRRESRGERTKRSKQSRRFESGAMHSQTHTGKEGGVEKKVTLLLLKQQSF